MEKRGRKSPFSLEERMRIAKECQYVCAKDLCKKYGIGNPSTIFTWKKRYLESVDSQKKSVTLHPEPIKVKDVKTSDKQEATPQEVEELQARITQLERQLKWEQMRSHALETMIDIAEEQGIKIRKKSGAK